MPSSEESAALDAGSRFLLERQDPDGLWRDYELDPGQSDAWTTSYAGVALARAVPGLAQGALARAREAVAALARPAGWGYNTSTACDADTTSWALRLLEGRPGVGALSPYLDESGQAHTFADPMFGSWSWAHADVTPAAGLALVAGRGPRWAVELLRDACLAAREPDGTWRSFWWTTDAYAVALNLEFLDVSGGIPADAVEAIRDWLAVVPAAASAFEAAQLVVVAALVGADASGRVSELVALQREDGGWPASAVLLVPSQETGVPGTGQADVRRLVTTATAIYALAQLNVAKGLAKARASRASRAHTRAGGPPWRR